MKNFRNLVGAIMMLVLPFRSVAWGVTGHRIVGGIAEFYLTAPAKKQIANLLGNETIAMASNWGDFVKSDSSYNYLNSWHYINIPGGMTESELSAYLRNDTNTDLYTKLNFVIAELKNKKLSREKQVFYLKLLIHFVGDANQPMHASHPEDKGGNSLRLSWFSIPSNLHRVWDENLIDFQQLSYTEYIQWINHPSATDKVRWQKLPLDEWIKESYKISEQLYSEVHSDDKLGYAYNYHHVKILNSQLLKGGLRLAAVLNDIFR